ncbi:hypothetical protein D3C85_1165600 [compost metagenome]
MRRRALAQDHRVLLAELPAHAAAGQQALQGLGDAVAAIERRALPAGHVLAGKQKVQARLVGEGGQGLVEALRWQVQGYFTFLLGAGGIYRIGSVHL